MQTLSHDPLAAFMRKEKIPLTRKNYIALTYVGELPDDWTRENEADMPAELQDWSLFGLVDGQFVLKKPMARKSAKGRILRNRRHGRRLHR
jgi:hypothetical protein